MTIETQYRNLIKRILFAEGESRQDRTGVGTLSVCFATLEHNLKHSFPLITSKKVYFKGVFEELMWMLRGQTNANILAEKGVHIWDKWATSEGELGPIYGEQWRNGIYDQIEYIIKTIKHNPHSRRILVHSWNLEAIPVEEITPQTNVQLGYGALPPCHYAFQFYVSTKGLSCIMHMRSSDIFLGLPFNIAQYALLTHIIAQECNLPVNTLHITLGDAHIYSNHIEQCKELLARKPHIHPELKFLQIPKHYTEWEYDMLYLSDYKTHPAIKAEVAY